MKFRPNFHQVLIRKIARIRKPGTSFADEAYHVLAMPYPTSPFLTLAEWPKQTGKEFPEQVIKVLVVPSEDKAAYDSWYAILEDEAQHWRNLLAKMLGLPRDVATFRLPLTPPARDLEDQEQEKMVEITEVGPIRRLEILDAAAGLSGTDLRFPYLTRPYIPWPSLQEVGFSTEQKLQKWLDYCARRDYSEDTKRDRDLFEHFCREALVKGLDKVILTSLWRLDLFAEKSQ